MASQSKNNKNNKEIVLKNVDRSSDSSLLEDSFDSEVQRKYGCEESGSNAGSSELCDSYDSEVQTHFKAEKVTKDEKEV